MKCPLLLPGVEQFELAVREPPEDEGRAEADERGDLWNERVVGCRDTEPDDPLGTEVERNGDGHSEQHSRGAAADGAPDHVVRKGTYGATPIEPDRDGAAEQDDHVEHQEVVEKPQVRERERQRRLRRQGGGRCRELAECLCEPPDPDGGHRREEDDPAGDERYENALRAIGPEPTSPLAFEHHPGKEAGDEKEQRHAEDVRGEEQYADGHARRAVVHRPDARDHARDEREAGVEDHAEQQRKRTNGVEAVQAISSGHTSSSKRSPRCAIERRRRNQVPNHPQQALHQGLR